MQYISFAFLQVGITFIVLDILCTFPRLFFILWLLVFILTISLFVSIPPYDYEYDDYDKDSDWYRQG